MTTRRAKFPRVNRIIKRFKGRAEKYKVIVSSDDEFYDDSVTSTSAEFKKQVEKLWQKRKQHINNDSSSSDSESERTVNNTQASTIDDQVQIEISEVILIFLNEIYF